METALITVGAIIILSIFYLFLPELIYTFQRYRRKKVLRCPETALLAEVDVDAARAAFSSFSGKSMLRVKNCSLWPKRKGCRQGCVKQGV